MPEIINSLAAYLPFYNKRSLPETEWPSTPAQDITFNFPYARNTDNRINTVNAVLEEALGNIVPGVAPVIRVSVGDAGSDANTADILSATLHYLTKSKVAGIFLDIRPLGKIGISDDLRVLSSLMLKGTVKEAKVHSISCKQNRELTYSKIKAEGAGLNLALTSSASPNKKIQAQAATQTLGQAPRVVNHVSSSKRY